MKKIILLITFSILFIGIGCLQPAVEEESETPLEHEVEEVMHKIPEGDLEVLEIEGCEYIVYKDSRGSNHGFGYMAHKGNCKNPIHSYKTTPILKDSIETLIVSPKTEVKE